LSRGGLAALFVLIGLTILQYRHKVRAALSLKRVLYIAAGSIVVIALGVGAIAAVSRKGNDADLTHNKTGVQTLISHLTDIRFFANKQDVNKKTSIGVRDIARQQAVSILKHSPKTLLVGAGAGQDPSTDAIKAFGQPNNLVLEMLLQYGLVGTVLFVGFVWYLFYELWRVRGLPETGLVATALLAYFVALLFQAQTFSGLALPHFWFTVGVAIALSKQKGLYKKRT
jgi:O-antigen ligase